MANRKFDEFVKEKNEAMKSKAPVDVQKDLSEWRTHLDDLYQTIEGFLKPYIEDQTIKLSFSEMTLTEDFSGPYEVKAGVIDIGGITVQLKPKGTMLIGSKDRIDMVGPGASVRLVLVGNNASKAGDVISTTIHDGASRQESPPSGQEPVVWVWRIATSPPATKFLPLEEEVFQDYLMSAANA